MCTAWWEDVRTGNIFHNDKYKKPYSDARSTTVYYYYILHHKKCIEIIIMNRTQ